MRNQRAAQNNVDLQPMAALASRFPEQNLHFIDLPYRLSSWALDDLENARLWFDESGALVAWAVLQTPFWSVDICIHPALGEAMFSEALVWAEDRIRKVAGTPFSRPTWYVNVFDSQKDFRNALESAGYADQADVPHDPWSIVWMSRTSLPVESGNRSLPAGYTIRPLLGSSELSAYVDLHRLVFQSDNMTEEWRRRTLMHPNYHPDLDLVVEAPDGSLAAFCIFWLSDDKTLSYPMGQVEPMGVHPDHRGSGLGKAVLMEGFKRLSAFGARDIYVETDNYRNAALSLYESVGFRVTNNVLVYRKDYE